MTDGRSVVLPRAEAAQRQLSFGSSQDMLSTPLGKMEGHSGDDNRGGSDEPTGTACPPGIERAKNLAVIPLSRNHS
jgi:hypothetical protein